MSVTPTGEVGKYLDGIMDHIANSSTFRTWFGAASAALGKAMIVIGESAPTTANQHVCVFSEPTTFRLESVGMAAPYASRFSAVVWFFGKFASDGFYSFDNNVGAIINEVLARSATGAGPRISTIEYSGPMLTSVEEDNDYYYADLMISTEL